LKNWQKYRLIVNLNMTDASRELPFLLKSGQVSIWDAATELNNRDINVCKSSGSNSRQGSPISINNAWNNDMDHTDEQNTSEDQR
jgi:hypothetical protein